MRVIEQRMMNKSEALGFQHVLAIRHNQNLFLVQMLNFIRVHKIAFAVAFTERIPLHHAAISGRGSTSIADALSANRNNAALIGNVFGCILIITAQNQHRIAAADDSFGVFFAVQLSQLRQTLQNEGNCNLTRTCSSNRLFKVRPDASVCQLVRNNVDRDASFTTNCIESFFQVFEQEAQKQRGKQLHRSVIIGNDKEQCGFFRAKICQANVIVTDNAANLVGHEQLESSIQTANNVGLYALTHTLKHCPCRCGRMAQRYILEVCFPLIKVVVKQSVIDIGDVTGRSILLPFREFPVPFFITVERMSKIFYNSASIHHGGFRVLYNLNQRLLIFLSDIRQLSQKLFCTALINLNQALFTDIRTIGNSNAEQVFFRAFPERVTLTVCTASRVSNNGLTEGNHTLVINVTSNRVIDFLNTIPRIRKVQIDKVKDLDLITTGLQKFTHIVVNFAFWVSDYNRFATHNRLEYRRSDIAKRLT